MLHYFVLIYLKYSCEFSDIFGLERFSSGAICRTRHSGTILADTAQQRCVRRCCNNLPINRSCMQINSDISQRVTIQQATLPWIATSLAWVKIRTLEGLSLIHISEPTRRT